MIKKLKFSKIKTYQEFCFSEEHIDTREMVCLKIHPIPRSSAPKNRTECPHCGTPLDKWVNAIGIFDLGRFHVCPEREVYLLEELD